MSKRIQSNLHLLNLLCICNKKQRIALIETLNKDQLLAICECIDNVLGGNVHLDKSSYNKISSKRILLREIVKKKPTQRKKKQALLLVQVGGALPALLIPAISFSSIHHWKSDRMSVESILIPKPSATEHYVKSLDDQIKHILNNKSLPLDIKYQLYSQILNK